MGDDAMKALLLANVRAGEIRAEKAGEAIPYPGVVRGAPTHSLAYLLQALEELGWTVTPAPEGSHTTGEDQRP